jgi:hypothetical protein
MDSRRGAPLEQSPASVTVVARTCAEADAMATALMVLGVERGAAFARQRGLSALFLSRTQNGGTIEHPVGPVFTSGAVAGGAKPALSSAREPCLPTATGLWCHERAARGHRSRAMRKYAV